MKQTVLSYYDSETECRGLLVKSNSARDSRPGVLVVHDIRGVGLYPVAHIKALIDCGYIVLLADMFGGGVSPDFADGRRLIGDLQDSPEKWRKRVGAALRSLMELSDVDSSRVAAVGYCFGGSTVLELALSGAPIKAAISMHGGLDRLSLHDCERVVASVLVCIGAEDPLIPADSVAAFQSALRAGHVKSWEVLTLSRAKHSYTNPQAPDSPVTGYDERADRRSLAAMISGLTEAFGIPIPG